MKRPAALLATLIATGLGCGGDGSSAPSKTNPYDGHWVGTTAENGWVYLTVRNNTLVAFSAAVKCLDGTNSYLALGDDLADQKPNTPATPLDQGQFQLIIPATTYLSEAGVAGRFDANRATGTIGPLSILNPACGPFTHPPTPPPYPKAAITFSAQQ